LRELLGDGAGPFETHRRVLYQYFRSLEHGVATFSESFGPSSRALQTLDPAGQEALRRDLGRLFQQYNRATDGTVAVECEYLQAVAARR
jgi:hypothetical protein